MGMKSPEGTSADYRDRMFTWTAVPIPLSCEKKQVDRRP